MQRQQSCTLLRRPVHPFRAPRLQPCVAICVPPKKHGHLNDHFASLPHAAATAPPTLFSKSNEPLHQPPSPAPPPSPCTKAPNFTTTDPPHDGVNAAPPFTGVSNRKLKRQPRPRSVPAMTTTTASATWHKTRWTSIYTFPREKTERRGDLRPHKASKVPPGDVISTPATCTRIKKN